MTDEQLDDYSDARDERDHFDELQIHLDHEDGGFTEGCDYCALDREAEEAHLAEERAHELVLDPTPDEQIAAMVGLAREAL